MFSGIIEEVASVQSFERKPGGGGALCVKSELDLSDTAVGDSIAVNGVCLTVVTIADGLLSFDLAEETLRCTSLGELRKGKRVNLEKSLLVGDRISGHFVFGHVDAAIRLVDKVEKESDTTLVWQAPTDVMRYITSKGSVAVAGVSLTVGEVTNNTFSVYIIPHTLEMTNLGDVAIGENVNLEIDMLARYVVNAVQKA